MGDFEALLDGFNSGNLVLPTADRRNIVDLANAIAYLIDVPDVPSSPNSAILADLIGPTEHLVLVAADGLGMNMIQQVESGFIARHVVDTLSTVFPSSTPVVFTSLATGLWPNQHAVMGWFTHYSEIDCVATTIRFVRRSDQKPLDELGLSTTEVFGETPLIQDSPRDSLSFLSPEEIAGSPFSNHTYGEEAQIGFKRFSEAANMVIHRLQSASGPTYTFLYTAVVDTLAHRYGVGHERVLEAIRALDRDVERLAVALPRDARLVMTADHGHLDSGTKYEIWPSDPLVTLLNREPWGDDRVSQFDVASGRGAEFENEFTRRFGEDFYIVSITDAERLHLFGPGEISPIARNRIGSYMAISKGSATLRYRYEGSHNHSQLAGHSGLTPDEMFVPMIVS